MQREFALTKKAPTQSVGASLNEDIQSENSKYQFSKGQILGLKIKFQ